MFEVYVRPATTPLQQGRAPLSAEVTMLLRLWLRNFYTSTGPRSFERGGPASASMRTGPLSALQQGRAPLSAEVVRREQDVEQPDTTSTGPRSFERGGRLMPSCRMIAALTSTGPRSFERGGWELRRC